MITVCAMMPTISTHHGFLPGAVNSFHKQIYPASWDVFLYIDPNPTLTLGAKLNAGIKHILSVSPVDYFVLLDSDDWHHPTRIARQIKPMLHNPKLMITGTSTLVYQNANTHEVWKYSGKQNDWLGGIAFRRVAIERHEFKSIGAGTDTQWQRNFYAEERLDLLDETLMLCTIHTHNTSPKSTTGRYWSRLPAVPRALRLI
jgi:glycosyltransferase involved in cell wall biosynthesis